MKSFRDIRVIPVVLIAIFGLAVLKVAGLVIDGGYVFDYQPQRTPDEVVGAGNPEFPGRQGRFRRHHRFGGGQEGRTQTGGRRTEVAKPDGVVVYPDQTAPVSASERAILERLQARRQELEAARPRSRHSREPAQVGRKAHRREGRGTEGGRSRGSTTATGQKAETDAARFKGIITMYEGMKPKDAAKVFDRLEMSVLFEIASQIAPRKMSDILGLMTPEAAERLTVELARRAGSDKSVSASASAADLPKIEGKVLPQKTN